jgi:hypothetical protein
MKSACRISSIFGKSEASHTRVNLASRLVLRILSVVALFEMTLVRNLYFADHPQAANSRPVESTGWERGGISPFGPAAELATDGDGGWRLRLAKGLERRIPLGVAGVEPKFPVTAFERSRTESLRL